MNLKKSINTGLAKTNKTNKELASHLSVSATAVTAMKTNNSTTGATLKRIADYFGVPLSEFIAWGE